jgi:hypothetical protein
VLRVVFGSVRVSVRRPSLTIELDALRPVTAATPAAPATPATSAGVRAAHPPRHGR